MTDRYFFFGLWRIPMYNYMWGYSAAQIELMSADQPFVAYKKDKPKREKGIFGQDQPNRKEMDDTVRRWQEKKKKGKTIDLNKFLSSGEKKELRPDNV